MSSADVQCRRGDVPRQPTERCGRLKRLVRGRMRQDQNQIRPSIKHKNGAKEETKNRRGEQVGRKQRTGGAKISPPEELGMRGRVRTEPPLQPYRSDWPTECLADAKGRPVDPWPSSAASSHAANQSGPTDGVLAPRAPLQVSCRRRHFGRRAFRSRRRPGVTRVPARRHSWLERCTACWPRACCRSPSPSKAGGCRQQTNQPLLSCP